MTEHAVTVGGQLGVESRLTAEDVYLSEKVDVQRASELLKVSKDTVLRWIQLGTVFPNAHKTGPGIRSPWAIPMTDITAFMSRQTGRPPADDIEEEEEE